MPRILSLDKMIQDLRGAMANENAQKGFMQGYQEGQARQAAAGPSAAETFDKQNPGVATSYLTDKGRRDYAENVNDGLGKLSPNYRGGQGQPAAAAPMPSNYDEMAQAYFQTLADMDKAEQADPIAAELRSREALQARMQGGVDVAALDAAHGNPTIPGAAPALQGAPPPPGGYDAPAPGADPEMLAALAAAANPQLGAGAATAPVAQELARRQAAGGPVR